MLSVMAAVLPIVGSLAVTMSVLAEQARLKAEKRVRVRVDGRVTELETKLTELYAAGELDYDVVTRRTTDLRELLLRCNGLTPRSLTVGDVNVSLSMSAPILPGAEVTRQWTLLLSSAAGVVLLAVDLATRRG